MEKKEFMEELRDGSRDKDYIMIRAIEEVAWQLKRMNDRLGENNER